MYFNTMIAKNQARPTSVPIDYTIADPRNW